MDSLLNEQDDTLGLNIVAQPVVKAPKAKVTKKKAKNKYEWYREKAQRKKEKKLQAQQQENDTKAAKDNDQEEEDTTPTEESRNDTTEKLMVVPAVRAETETLQEAVPEFADELADDKSNDDPTATVPSKFALPEDDEERAKYLREFHARPLELDRRAHALTKVRKSKESQHLFADAAQWSTLELLHPRIVSALTNSLNMAQPTSIQARAIPAFLKPSSDAVNGKTERWDAAALLNNKSKNASQQTANHNILLHSETGSGKTMAYLVPILQSLAVDLKTNQSRQTGRIPFGTRCLILCPTRELAAQTFSMVERLCTSTFHWIVPGCLLGGGDGGNGSSRKSEKMRLRKGLGVVVATPGRLLDHLSKTESLLMALKGKLEWVVLDEADRMIQDMGLGDQVKQIMQRIMANHAGSSSSNHSWRSVLVSATVTPSVQKLATETLIGGDQSWVWIKSSPEDKDRNQRRTSKTPSDDQQHDQTEEHDNELADATPRQLAQYHMMVSAKWRLQALIALLVQRMKLKQRTVVFFSTCASVDFHHALLTTMDSILDDSDEVDGDIAKGIFGNECPIYKLHGSVPHSQRQEVLRSFLRHNKSHNKKNADPKTDKPKQAAILLATDVAARGLNLEDCEWTIQYDPPSEVSDYAHRAGRVARAGRGGQSLLFLLPSEKEYLAILKKRGVPKLLALSLSASLNAAANVCTSVSKAGVDRSGGGLGSGGDTSKNRTGEAFSSELQRRLEGFLEKEDATARAILAEKKRQKSSGGGKEQPPLNLMDMARDAFLSHIRAYPTREKMVKHIFSTKALHLGHIARSFALKEPPKRVGSRKQQEAEAGSGVSERKRSAALAFGGKGGKEKNEKGGQEKKKDRAVEKQLDGQVFVDPKKARIKMMENAKKLRGMDAF